MTNRSPTTIGDDSPGGAGTFHLTFLSGPNSTGGFWSSATPDPLGPRNCGQASGLSAASPTAATATRAADVNIPFMQNPPMVLGPFVSGSERIRSDRDTGRGPTAF